ncbi:MAG TPA: RHS repeat-associated core domain-containing protein [Anaerolineae bacterium]|nr:RHS repeat-associated core domain-containing protein [Anaerolineae bacterium]
METLTRRYVYDNEDIIAILDADGTPLHTFTHGPGIDEPLIMTRADGANYFYHADALGSITVLTDGNKEIVETYTYKAYGQPTIKDSLGAVFDKSAIENLYFFTARELDSESGLYYYRARYYDWNSGAFTQEDPAGFVAGETNLYTYVTNNPVGLMDPFGLWYIDLNITIGIWGGLTRGVIFDSQGIYTYKGGGAVSPYGGISLTVSKDAVMEGLNFAIQPSLPIGPLAITGQYGATLSKGLPEFTEIGISWPPVPGISMTAYNIEMHSQWPWAKETLKSAPLVKYPAGNDCWHE